MTVSYWQADGTQPQRDVDLLIVGAGLAGCSAAYHARQLGLRAVVTDKADLAQGASGRNAGFMITGLDAYYHKAEARYGAAVTREMWQLSRETIAFWKRVIADAGGKVQADTRGSLLLAESAEEADDLAQAARALQANSIDVRFYDYDPLERGYHAAILQPEDGAVHPVQLTQALLEQSEAELLPNNEVYAITQDAPDVVKVATRHVIFRARRVLLCTNAYSPFLHEYFVGKVVPTRAQVLVTEPLPISVIPYCGYSNYGYMYYRMTFDGRLLLGGARHTAFAQENDTSEDCLNPFVQAQLDGYLRRYFPDVSAAVARRWSGIMGFSVDGLPLVGTLPDMPRVGFAVGFTGHGLALAAGVTRRALRLLVDGENAGAVDAARLCGV